MPKPSEHTTIPLATLEAAAASVERDGRMAVALATAARAVYGSPEYRDWITGGLAEKLPFEASAPLPEALVAMGLGGDRVSFAKINVVGDHVFLTDGVWVDKAIRVFPFTDESITLTTHAVARMAGFAPDTIVDLATGSGHNAIGYPGHARRFAFDVSPRALAYARINRAMNLFVPGALTIMANDVRDGVPPAVGEARPSRVLFLANMPFAPSPGRGVLPKTSDGGESGVYLQLATVTAIGDFAEAMGPSCHVRASILGITVCDPANDRWEMMDAAVERFGADKVSWTLLSDESVYRIDGKRTVGNPLPLHTALPGIAECRLYIEDAERDAVRAGYRDLAESLERRGWTHLAYGVVDVDLAVVKPRRSGSGSVKDRAGLAIAAP